MQIISSKILLIILLLIFNITSISGCSEVRKLTYPEDFTYVEDKEIKSLMRQMSKGVERLEKIVREAKYSDTTQQQVISEIGKLESISARLSSGHTQTNQLFISDHIEKFNSDISTAKMFAKTTPPDYSKIMEVANNCQQCHKWR